MDKKIIVSQAFLHTSILVPGVVFSEATLSKEKVKTIKAMYLTPMGLLIEAKNDKGAEVQALVPSANVKVLVLAEEEKKPAKTS